MIPIKLRDRAKDILNLFNYYGGAVIVNTKGIIEHYYNSVPEVNSVTPEEAVGKNILEVYRNISEETSVIYRVLKSGEPVYDYRQDIINFKGEKFTSLNSTFPIKKDEKIIGAVEIYDYKNSKEIQHRLHVEIPKGSLFNLYAVNDIVSVSEKMDVLKERIKRAAASNSVILIYGKTGTGKELVAQSIHTGSSRCNEKFIAQNCAAIPGNLLESILFGTVKGSYTDATDRIGLFEAANGGTLFLDEIHAMDQSVQAKLLKAIEEQKIYRVGSVDSVSVNVRVIAAVNREPMTCIAEELLREDLYYRLKVVQLDVPALKDRKEDIESLTNYFINQFNKKMGRNIKGVSESVLSFFMAYDWPGNVRELRNIIECAFNFTRSEYIQLEDIDSYKEEILRVGRHGFETYKTLKDYMREYEKEIVKKVVETSDSISQAAERMCISKQTLYNKLKEFSIKGWD